MISQNRTLSPNVTADKTNNISSQKEFKDDIISTDNI
jgi:hypothetical protein